MFGDGTKCPFLSGVAFNGSTAELFKVDCMGEECVFWNEETESCGFLNMMNLSEHTHNKHLHGRYPHDFEDREHLPGGSSGGFMPLNIPKAGNLVTEFMNGEDIDGDGYVYGIHFMIDTKTAPETIKSFNEGNRHKFEKDIPVVDWGDYLNWKNFLGTRPW